MPSCTMIKIPANLFVLMLAMFAVAQEDTHGFEGVLPPGVPETAVLQAMVIDDMMASFSTVPLATTEVVDGTFSFLLPAELHTDQLPEMQVCGGGTINIALLTHIEVLVDGERVGELWRTNETPGSWDKYGPSAHTYLAYVREPLQLEDDCWGDVTELNLEPGWNLYTRIPTDSGSLTTSEVPPEDFIWQYWD